jgi:hypothetical protein
MHDIKARILKIRRFYVINNGSKETQISALQSLSEESCVNLISSSGTLFPRVVFQHFCENASCFSFRSPTRLSIAALSFPICVLLWPNWIKCMPAAFCCSGQDKNQHHKHLTQRKKFSREAQKAAYYMYVDGSEGLRVQSTLSHQIKEVGKAPFPQLNKQK